MSDRVPSYRRHKSSGQAVVTLPDGLGGRKDITLGWYGSRESRLEYARVIAEWEANGRRLPQPAAATNLSVNELLIAYWQYAGGYYQKNGEPTSQLDRVKLSMKPVKNLYGHTSAAAFGPLALKAVREWMVQAGWCRRYVNQCIGCVKRMWKWAVANELVPPSTFHGLQAVEGLKKGRTPARESKPVPPVEDGHIEATLPYLLPPVQAMVKVQRLTGMRPCEVVLMRPCDIDRGDPRTWAYRPESHKTEHHGVERVIFLGSAAQEVLQPFLFRDPGKYLFSPQEGMEAHWGKLRNDRKTKVQPSQMNRMRRRPKKLPGERYSTGSYDRAIASAVKRANRDRAAKDELPIPSWAPNQLRHSLATIVRQRFGLEGAQVALGHQQANVTEIYATRDQALARRIAAEIG